MKQRPRRDEDPHMGVSKNRGKTPQIIHFNRVFHYFSPSILGVFPLFLETPIFWPSWHWHWRGSYDNFYIYISIQRDVVSLKPSIVQFDDLPDRSCDGCTWTTWISTIFVWNKLNQLLFCPFLKAPKGTEVYGPTRYEEVMQEKWWLEVNGNRLNSWC